MTQTHPMGAVCSECYGGLTCMHCHPVQPPSQIARIAKLEARLAAVRLALHPRDTADDVGAVSHDPCSDLEGVIIDMERANADPVCVETVRRVQRRILAAMLLLEKGPAFGSKRTSQT